MLWLNAGKWNEIRGDIDRILRTVSTTQIPNLIASFSPGVFFWPKSYLHPKLTGLSSRDTVSTNKTSHLSITQRRHLQGLHEKKKQKHVPFTGSNNTHRFCCMIDDQNTAPPGKQMHGKFWKSPCPTGKSSINWVVFNIHVCFCLPTGKIYMRVYIDIDIPGIQERNFPLRVSMLPNPSCHCGAHGMQVLNLAHGFAKTSLKAFHDIRPFS